MNYRAWWEEHLGPIRWQADGNGRARCPFHEDRTPSLSVHRKTGLWYCFAGCGSGTAEAFAARRGVTPPPRDAQTPEAVYDYQDEAGRLLFQVVRFPGKRFRQRRPDGLDGWRWNLQGVRRVLYRLPGFLAGGDPVYIVEGEKDAETLQARGFTATTNPGGAGKWRDDYSPALRDRLCVLLPDQDEPGRRHMEAVARAVGLYAARVVVLDLPGLPDKGDVSDWFAQGHTPEELQVLIQRVEEAQVLEASPREGAPLLLRAGAEEGVPGPVPSLRDLLPERGWLRDYVAYGEAVTDAPLAYHLFAGLTCLAVALGRRLWIPFGATPIYPNLYVCLLGPSALARKSTVLRIAAEILGRFEEHAVLPGEFSPERLVGLLKEHPTVCCLWSEFGAFLRYAERSYMLGIKEQLTYLYECPPELRRALQTETVVVKEPTLSLLTASTPEWLLAHMDEVDLLGGFFPRFLYVFFEPPAQSFAIPPAGDPQKVNLLVEGLQRVKALNGPVEFGETRARYEEFYAGVQQEAQRAGGLDLYGVFLGRLPVHVLKLALCLHAVEGEGLTLAPDTMARAIGLGEWLSNRLHAALRRGLALNPKERERVRLLALIQRAPGITRGLLLRHSHLSAKELDEALTTLEQAGQVQVKGKGVRGEPFRYHPQEAG